jgi:ABC-type glycerol-3-phosphate transport system substrate-binding protein
MHKEISSVEIRKSHSTSRIVKIVVLAATIAAVVAALLLPNIHTERPDPSFIVLHSFSEGSPQAKYIEKTALPLLKRQYSDIEAAAVYCDESKIDSEALRMKNEGKAPDVVFLTPEAMASLAQLGALAPLNDNSAGEASEPLAVRQAYIDGGPSAGMIEGTAYGIPVDVSIQALLYNPAMLPGVGGQPPSGLDQFWDMLGALSSGSGGKAGFILPDAGMKSLAPFVWSSGGELVNNEGTKAYGYLNNAKNITVFDRFAAALESGGIVVAEGKDEALALFAAGEAAMAIADTSDIAAFSALYPGFAFKTAPFPAGPSGSVSVLGCKYVSITTDSKKDAAVSFLMDILSSGVMGTEPAAGIPEAALASARPLPASWSMADMQNEFMLAMKQATEGYKTTQQALDDLSMKWDAYL